MNQQEHLAIERDEVLAGATRQILALQKQHAEAVTRAEVAEADGECARFGPS